MVTKATVIYTLLLWLYAR